MTSLSPTITIKSLNLNTRRAEINNEHDKAIESLIECGRLLVDTQDNLADEQSFVSFCDTLKFKRATAYNYMRLYSHSLVQRLDSLQDAMINLSVWYQVKPEDSETIQKVQALADSGKKVTRKLAKQLVAETAPLNQTLLDSADTAPDFVADAIMRGVITDIDGNDIPIDEADSTLIRVNTDQFLYESTQRQRVHIENKMPKRTRLDATLKMIADRNGVVYLAIDTNNLPANLSGKQVTIYYEELAEFRSQEREAA